MSAIDCNAWNIPWSANAGIELTYVHPKERKANHGSYLDGRKIMYLSGLADEIRNIHFKVFAEEPARGHWAYDPGCVEFSTPVLRSWEDAQSVWEYGLTMAEQHGLRPYVHSLGTGMGHINVQASPKLANIVTVDLYCRPYLAWAFSHPDAVRYCKPYHEHPCITPTGFPSARTAPINHDKFTAVATRQHCRSSCFGTTQGSTVLEYRFFDSAETWEEQYSYLALAQRYTEFMRRRKYEPVLAGRHLRSYCAEAGRSHELIAQLTLSTAVKERYQGNLDNCVQDFRQFIEMLDLPWSAYEHLVEQNLKPWMLWGWSADRSREFTRHTRVPESAQVLSFKAGMFDPPKIVKPVISKGAFEYAA